MTTKDKSLQDYIDDCKFDYIDEQIPSLFKTEPVASKVEVRNFGKYMTSEEVIAELKKDGCRPANATELFAWYTQNQEWLEANKYSPVVALGSVVTFERERLVCNAWLHDAERSALLYWFDRDWSGHCWFAFGRESFDTETSNPQTLSTLPDEITLNGRTYRAV